MKEYHELLRRHHLRDTAPRRHVFEVLLAATAPLSIADIARDCPLHDRSTVYRSVATLLAIGAVQAVPLGWKQRYEVTSLFRAHHHHLQCTECGQVVDIASTALERLVQHEAARLGFVPTSHMFEIAGVCRECRQKTTHLA